MEGNLGKLGFVGSLGLGLRPTLGAQVTLRTPIRRHSAARARRDSRRCRTTAVVDGAQVAVALEEAVGPGNGGSLAVSGLVFFLTFWGIISFIKGSTKERIIQTRYETKNDPDDVMRNTVKHFTTRSFKVNREADARPGVITFEGLVRPSNIVAGLLLSTGGAALWGLGVILNLYLPSQYQSDFFNYLPILSVALVPWYWNGASRLEQFKLMMEENDPVDSRTVYVKGHRDEIAEYERALSFKRVELEDEE